MKNKKRIIDADAVRNALYEADAITMNGVAIINQFPTEDAVEVVRCKYCKHYKEHPASKRMCCYVHLLTPHHMPEDGFCSYGERKSDDT